MFSVIKKFFFLIEFKKVRMRKIYCTNCKKYKEFKNPKISFICYKTLLFVVLILFGICNKCKSEDEKIFKEEESIERLKILGLITNIEEYQKI